MRQLLLVGVILVLVSALAWAEETTVRYTYDEAGRLVGVSYGTNGQIEYVYDAAGNLIERRVKGLEVCVPGDQTLCLTAERFAVEVEWIVGDDQAGHGRAVPLTDDTGYFWFFQDSNIELVVKVLDGTALNGHFWVFYGALSNVEYWLTVTDTVTGNTAAYHNPLGTMASVGDTSALPGSGFAAATSTAAAAHAEAGQGHGLGVSAPLLDSCTPSSQRLCLNHSRFAVEVSWRDRHDATGEGHAVPLTGDTGYFWFFDDANVELVVKVLDGSAINGNYWVFYGSLSNVEYTITVTDTSTGEVQTYFNPLDHFGSFADTAAFPAGG